MVRYNLEDLTSEMATKPQLAERLFSYHTNNGRYGANAAAAIGVPENARTYAQQTAVATTKGFFDAERASPAINKVLLNTYLPVYSRERNQRELRGGLVKSGLTAGTGIVAIVLGLFVDSEVAKFFLETVGTGSTIAGMTGAGITYLKYRA